MVEQNIMKLFEIEILNKTVLFKLEEYTENFLKGEFLYPFSFSVDYYEESGLADNIEYEMFRIISCLGTFLIRHQESIHELTDMFPAPVDDLSESKKQQLKDLLINEMIKPTVPQDFWKFFGKTFKDELADALYNTIARKPSGFTVKDRNFFKEVFFSNPGIQCIYGRNEKFDYSLFYDFLRQVGKFDITFKTTKPVWYGIPDEFVEICSLEEFLMEDSRIPLFVEKASPIVPELTDEIAVQLESRTVAFLCTGAITSLSLSNA